MRAGFWRTAEWARQVVAHTGKPVLLLTPLAVAHQTQAEAERFGYAAKACDSWASRPAGVGIVITNYEKLEHFDVAAFGGVVLDGQDA